MLNEVISIIGITEVNIHGIEIPIKENIYTRTDVWFKARSISTGYNLVTIYDGPFQSGVTYIMAVDEVSCRVITIGLEFSIMGRW